jgi:hypothetical protein
MGFFYVAACLTALALHPLKGTDHFATIFWGSNEAGNSISLRLGKGDYAAIMASLERVTGQGWRGQDQLAVVLGVDRYGIDVEFDRETALGPVILLPGSYRMVFTRAASAKGFVVLFSGAPGQRIPVTSALVEAVPLEDASSGAAVQYGMEGKQVCVARLKVSSLLLRVAGCQTD